MILLAIQYAQSCAGGTHTVDVTPHRLAGRTRQSAQVCHGYAAVMSHHMNPDIEHRGRAA